MLKEILVYDDRKQDRKFINADPALSVRLFNELKAHSFGFMPSLNDWANMVRVHRLNQRMARR